MLFTSHARKFAAETAEAARVPEPPALVLSHGRLQALVEAIVEQTPAIFGRFACVAAFWDSDQRIYRHPRLGPILPGQHLERILHALHLQLFFQWLALGAHEQRDDFLCYISRHDFACKLLLPRLRDASAIAAMAPPDATAHERTLFVSDMLVLIETVLPGHGIPNPPETGKLQICR